MEKKTQNRTKTKSEDVFQVVVDIPNLNIRKGPGYAFERTGEFTGEGLFEITKTENGWGQLADGRGWICLEYFKELHSPEK